MMQVEKKKHNKQTNSSFQNGCGRIEIFSQDCQHPIYKNQVKSCEFAESMLHTGLHSQLIVVQK